MNKVIRMILSVVVVVLAAVALLWVGFSFGRSTGFWGTDYDGMRGSYLPDGDQRWSGMMRGRTVRPGEGKQFPCGNSAVMGPSVGMMNDFGTGSTADPLTVPETHEAVESYLAAYDDQELVIKEIMIFDNNAYAVVLEDSTGIGAFELLIDPATKEVYPEYGPNMMWNLKYGMMGGTGGYGMMGSGMMRGSGYNTDPRAYEGIGEMSIRPEEALETAQRYLNEASPGTKVSDEITPFYGYYTIDIERNGEITGMLSVNGSAGQVFPHTWHGEFIEMSEE